MAGKVFSDLSERARAAGATRVQFEVDLDRFLAGPTAKDGVGLERSWCARTGADEDEIAVRFGRTGEEAFRSVVEATEKRK